MNLHEYQAKQLFKKYSIPTPIGCACATSREAEEAASKIGIGPWVVKCQVHAGGRGKSGGVKIVYNKQEVYSFAENWLGKRLVTYQTGIEGQLVTNILVEEATNIDHELYLSAVVDNSIRRVVCMASIKGGVNIEEIAVKTPSLIHQITLDPLIGPQPYQGRDLAFKLGLNGNQINKFTNIFVNLSKMFLELDLSLAEINPLVITKKGDLICLDGKITVDDNALFRQPDLSAMYDLSQENSREAQALQSKLNYIALEGNIGCMVNGAGLAMGTMDIIKRYGGKPANFLDVGGNVTKDRVTEAFRVILSDNAVKSILINIFGGIVRCDLIADGIINAIDSVGFNIPVVVRLEGNHSELGIKKLVSSSLNIFAATSIAEAAQLAVAAARE